MDSSPQQLRDRLLEMPSDQVKSLMLAWLQDDTLGLQQFSNWVAVAQPNLEWGTVTPQLEFQSLAEAEMIAQSLVALTAYQGGEKAIAQADMEAWANSLGSEDELQCPQ